MTRTWTQKDPHGVVPQYVVNWDKAKISASVSILRSYQEMFEVDSFSTHVPLDDEDSESAGSTFFSRVDLLSVSAVLEDVSTAWMDENISFDDCSAILK